MSDVRDDITVAIVTIGRPSLNRTLAAIALGSGTRLRSVLVVDNARGKLSVLPWVRERLDIRIVPGPGPAAASRNLALDLADTDLVAFTDDDCLPSPTWVDDVAAYLVEWPDAAAAFGRVKPGSHSARRVIEVPIPGVGLVAWGEADDGCFCPAITAPSWRTGPVGRPTLIWAAAGSSNNLAIRRSRMLPDRLPFRTDLGPGSSGCSGEDTEFGYALLRSGRRIDHVGNATVLHERWVEPDRSVALSRCYLRGNVLALACHCAARDGTATTLLADYLRHVRSLRGLRDIPDLLAWAFEEDELPPPAHDLVADLGRL